MFLCAILNARHISQLLGAHMSTHQRALLFDINPYRGAVSAHEYSCLTPRVCVLHREGGEATNVGVAMKRFFFLFPGAAPRRSSENRFAKFAKEASKSGAPSSNRVLT